LTGPTALGITYPTLSIGLAALLAAPAHLSITYSFSTIPSLCPPFIDDLLQKHFPTKASASVTPPIDANPPTLPITPIITNPPHPKLTEHYLYVIKAEPIYISKAELKDPQVTYSHILTNINSNTFPILKPSQLSRKALVKAYLAAAEADKYHYKKPPAPNHVNICHKCDYHKLYYICYDHLYAGQSRPAFSTKLQYL
jgi:hypothetical protein